MTRAIFTVQAEEPLISVTALPDPWAAAGLPTPQARTVYLETYGCQMNISDSEVRG